MARKKSGWTDERREKFRATLAAKKANGAGTSKPKARSASLGGLALIEMGIKLLRKELRR
jgi:hypothetical protein